MQSGTMGWLRGPARVWRSGAGAARGGSVDPHVQYEPLACYQTFCKHWQQALHIITASQEGSRSSQQDEVLGVVSHVEQTATLLALEARACDSRGAESSGPNHACLEHLLAGGLLQKLYNWGLTTGRYASAVVMEQLRLHRVLLRWHGATVLRAEPSLKPLLQLLHRCASDLQPQHVQDEVVSLLSQLCVILVQHVDLLDQFFVECDTPQGPLDECVVVRLLLGSVHSEGATGAAARDSLLLCANMASRHRRLERCLLPPNSHACVVLATGLSGLYSLLPRTLPAAVPHDQRLLPDDVSAVSRLPLFLDSLEFCDAVAQVSPPAVRRSLVDLFHHGFLVPVLGPALLQGGAGETVAGVVYLELCIRSVSPRGLLRTVLTFVLLSEYDGVRLLDAVLARLQHDSQVALVTLGLLDTLVELNCEDVMLELVYRHLPAYRGDACGEQFRAGAAALLALAPECCVRVPHAADDDADRPRRDYADPKQSLLGNYHAYLCEARHEITSRAAACSRWTSPVSAISPGGLCSPGGRCSPGSPRSPGSLTSLGYSSGYDSYRARPDDGDAPDAEDAFWSELAVDVDKATQARAADARGGGPLLAALLGRASTLLECEPRASVLVSGLLSKLAAFPTPSLAAALLCPGSALHQVLQRLKREADAVTRACADTPELVRRARAYLVRRERALARRRASPSPPPQPPAPPQPRRSLSTSITHMFARRLSAGGTAISPGGGESRTEDAYWSGSVTRRTVLNAVLLDEWLRELAARATLHATLTLT